LEKTGYDNTQLELFWAECFIDYIYFAEHVLGFDVAKYHKEWTELTEKFQRLCIISFRGSGKTNWFCGYMVWRAIFREGFSCLTVSHNFDEAKRLLKIVRNMILDNELLKDFAPEGRNQSWRATEITLKNGSVFYAKTYGEGMRGLRIDLAFFDEAGQYNDKSIFWTAAVPVVQLNRGRIIVSGTRKSPIDLLGELSENSEYFSKEYPAEKDGKALWSQKYTTADNDMFGKRSLKQIRREIGDLAYQQEYLLIPISRANEVFPMEKVMQCLDDYSSFIDVGVKNEVYFVGVDLAISAKGDYTVLTVISADSSGKKLVYAERFRGGINMQINRLKFIYDRFRPAKILVDKTGLGEQIFRDMAQEIPAVKPFHFTEDEKYSILMDLRHEFETLRLSLPASKKDTKTYSYLQILLKELQDFQFKADLSRKSKLKFTSGKYDDTVISLALANRASKSAGMEYSIGFI